ncbi:FTH1 [Mytilus coruscus]|uniref:Ferritin n=1 Tax=Mytilus coruscus TaxID=42192 RepID=A0A6J8AL47_MYTCO|nr:FTH1 [Mytilus coruscus]
MSQTQPRQNFHAETEAGINKQINVELHASYIYQSMAYYFDRDDIALPGFHKYFEKLSKQKRCEAEKLMEYQNKRGGRIVLQDVQKPDKDEWKTGLDAVQTSLSLEKKVNEAILALHKISCTQGDAHFEDFLEDHFLSQQVEIIKTLSDYGTRLKNVGPGLGEYIFDKDLSS